MLNLSWFQNAVVKRFSQRSGQVLTALSVGIGLAIAGLPQAQAQGSEISIAQATVTDAVQRQALSDGVYLYGQSAEPDQLGSAYLVFEVQQNQVTGAFYMPHSSFDCFQGEFAGDRLALNIVDSYEQTVHPYSIALQADSSVASADGDAVAPLGLQGFHQLETISENDERILATCQADFQQEI